MAVRVDQDVAIVAVFELQYIAEDAVGGKTANEAIDSLRKGRRVRCAESLGIMVVQCCDALLGIGSSRDRRQCQRPLERMQRYCVGDGLDKSRRLTSHQNPHILHPNVNTMLRKDLGAHRDKLTCERFLAKIISCLDNDRDQVPALRPSVWR